MAGLQKKSLDTPDEQFRNEGIAADVVQVGDAAIARHIFQPGAHCALGGGRMAGSHRADKSCYAAHTGLILSGQLHVEMDDGSTLDVGPNDVYNIPPGHDGWVIGDQPLQAVNWAGVRTWIPEHESGERVVATLMFTDIVGSTERAVQIGDTAWRELLGEHNRLIRQLLDRYRGREITTTGDGFLAIFDGAARAIRAAIAIRDAATGLGLAVRIGVHTAEVELVGDDVRGVAVHEASRIAATAGAGEIYVSATTQVLSVGADLSFTDLGTRDLKGLQGSRQLYAVS
jgi:class 3 adenylate cyclase